MLDYKTGQPQKALDDATLMLVQLDKMLGTLVVNRDQALAEVNADYSTTTELADVLQREYNVPFRVGHGFASDLVTYGRNNHLTPAQLPYEEAQKAFAKALRIPSCRRETSRCRTTNSIEFSRLRTWSSRAPVSEAHNRLRWKGCWALRRLGSTPTSNGSPIPGPPSTSRKLT